jgi:hypothetical protein
MACLLDLPTEILQQIAGHLARITIQGFEDHGICNLRLACRSLCLKTEYEFGRAAFSTLQLDLHSKTLQRLLHTCKRPAFGEAVKKLIFAHREHAREYVAFPHVPDEESGGLEEQVLFVLKSVLDEAFGGTPNLREVVILTPCDALFRRHDYIPPVGLMAMSLASNDAIHVEETRVKGETLYALVTRALIDAGLRISAFQLPSEGRRHQKWYLPAVSITESTLAATSEALKHVERLEVMIRCDKDLGPPASLGQTLSTMSLLTQLELRITQAVISPGPRHIIDPTTAAIQSLHDVHLPRLACLTFSEVTFDECVLRKFLLTHTSTLQTISLQNVYLGRYERWDAIIALLFDEMVSLTTLHLAGVGVDLRQPSLWGKVSLNGRDSVMDELRNMLGRAELYDSNF